MHLPKFRIKWKFQALKLWDFTLHVPIIPQVSTVLVLEFYAQRANILRQKLYILSEVIFVDIFNQTIFYHLTKRNEFSHLLLDAKKGKKPPVTIWLWSHGYVARAVSQTFIWLMINTWWTRSLNLMSTNDFRGRLLLWKATYLRTLAIWIGYFYNPLFLRFLPILSPSGNLEKWDM